MQSGFKESNQLTLSRLACKFYLKSASTRLRWFVLGSYSYFKVHNSIKMYLYNDNLQHQASQDTSYCMVKTPTLRQFLLVSAGQHWEEGWSLLTIKWHQSCWQLQETRGIKLLLTIYLLTDVHKRKNLSELSGYWGSQAFPGVMTLF